MSTGELLPTIRLPPSLGSTVKEDLGCPYTEDRRRAMALAPSRQSLNAGVWFRNKTSPFEVYVG